MVNDLQIDYRGGVSGNPIDVNAACRDETSFFGRFYRQAGLFGAGVC
jgi:hypothetical protein